MWWYLRGQARPADDDSGEDLPARLAAAERDRDGWAGKFAELQTEFASLSGRLPAYENSIQNWTQKAAAWDADRDRLVAELRAYGEANGHLEVRAAELAGTVQQLRDELAAQEGVIAELRARTAELEAQLQLELASDRADDAAYESAIVDLRAQVARLEAERKPMSMAAAAGAGAAILPAAGPVLTAVVPESRYTELDERFRAFVARTQKDGWGDIERIEGIGPVYGQKLRAAGVAWVQDLLERAGSAEGRQQLAELSGIHRDFLLKWVNAADLLRIEGITPDWAELLEEAGVPTVKELARRSPGPLHERLVETNERGRFARAVPDPELVAGWISAAAKLEPGLTV